MPLFRKSAQFWRWATFGSHRALASRGRNWSPALPNSKAIPSSSRFLGLLGEMLGPGGGGGDSMGRAAHSGKSRVRRGRRGM